MTYIKCSVHACYYYPHLMDEKTENQLQKVTCPRLLELDRSPCLLTSCQLCLLQSQDSIRLSLFLGEDSAIWAGVLIRRWKPFCFFLSRVLLRVIKMLLWLVRFGAVSKYLLIAQWLLEAPRTQVFGFLGCKQDEWTNKEEQEVQWRAWWTGCWGLSSPQLLCTVLLIGHFPPRTWWGLGKCPQPHLLTLCPQPPRGEGESWDQVASWLLDCARFSQGP